MEIRYSCNQRDFKRYTTEETRKEFLIENLYAANEVVAVYSHVDRMVTLGCMPTTETVPIDKGIDIWHNFGTQYFLERRERRRVVRPFQVFERQPFHCTRFDGKRLWMTLLFQLQRFFAAVRKRDDSAFPPTVVREVRPQGQPQFVNAHRPAEGKRPFRVRIPVDAPALVRPFTVRAVFINAVDCIVGREHSLPACFHIGPRMRVNARIAVSVVGIERQVPPRGDLFRAGDARTDKVAAARKALG